MVIVDGINHILPNTALAGFPSAYQLQQQPILPPPLPSSTTTTSQFSLCLNNLILNNNTNYNYNYITHDNNLNNNNNITKKNINNSINNNNNNNNNNNKHNTTTNASAAAAAAAAAASLISPENEQQLPCEQYKEFLDASHNEKVDMIDNLVDVSVDIIDSIWPQPNHAKVVATRGFIREILKRSKTTYFMLQISLFYIFRVKRVVQSKLRIPTTERSYSDELMCCGRRMFLASLMVASKYIHDKSYRNKAWADASGLNLKEINASELAFLQMIDYRLYVSKPTFEKWYGVLNQRLKQKKQSTVPPPPTTTTTTTTTTAQYQKQPIVSSSQQQQRYARHQQQYPLNAPINPTTAKLVNGHMVSVSSKNPILKTPVSITSSPSRISSVTTAQYPSPASPCFYHPDFQLPT
ncbi:unnamed protein product [Cunninghamella echinulata]